MSDLAGSITSPAYSPNERKERRKITFTKIQTSSLSRQQKFFYEQNASITNNRYTDTHQLESDNSTILSVHVKIYQTKSLLFEYAFQCFFLCPVWDVNDFYSLQFIRLWAINLPTTHSSFFGGFLLLLLLHQRFFLLPNPLYGPIFWGLLWNYSDFKFLELILSGLLCLKWKSRKEKRTLTNGLASWWIFLTLSISLSPSPALANF